MMRLSMLSVSLLLLVASPALLAQQRVEDLLNRHLCFACHQPDKPSIGPSWQAIAARHQGRRAQMTPVLVSKIIRGGGGNWGLVPMVPNQRVNEAEAALMLGWILDQAP